MSEDYFGCVLKAAFKHTPNTTNSDQSAHKTDTSRQAPLPLPSQRSRGDQNDCVLFQYRDCAIDHSSHMRPNVRAQGGGARHVEQRRETRG